MVGMKRGRPQHCRTQKACGKKLQHPVGLTEVLEDRLVAKDGPEGTTSSLLMSTLAHHESSNHCSTFSPALFIFIALFFKLFLNYCCLSAGNFKVKCSRTEIHFLDSLVYLIPK